MSSIQLDELIPLADVAKQLPQRNGKPVHPSTVARWGRNGLQGIRLDVTRVGGRTCTSARALEQFFSNLSEAAEQRRASASSSPKASIDRGDQDRSHDSYGI